MIVCCPACHTRYRYREAVPSGGGQARCAKCDGLVPLIPARPTYVLQAEVTAVPRGVPVGAGFTIGMDDPAQASSLQSTALDAEGVGASTIAYGMMPPEAQPGSDLGESPSAAPDIDVDALPLADRPAEPARPVGDQPVLATVAEAPAARVAAPKRSRAPRAPRVKQGPGVVRRIVQLLVLIALVAAGAGGGYYAGVQGFVEPLRVHPMVDPIHPAALGGLVGVLLAWVIVRWTGRGR